MKILANLPSAIKLLYCLRYLKGLRRQILGDRAAENFEAEREGIRESASSWGINMLKTFGSELVIHGKENIPAEGPVVIMGNHQGYCDIPAVYATFDNMQVSFVAKKELARIPIYGAWMRNVRTVFLQRDDARASMEAIKEGIKNIKQGFNMVIFPEGTRAKCSTPGKFMHGSFRLATRPGVPIVPISINGTYRMFEEKGVLKGTRIDVMIHPPIPTKGLDRQAIKELPEHVEAIIHDGVRKLVEIQAGAGIESVFEPLDY